MDKITRMRTVTVPVRIIDLGGWTDTGISGHGQVFNLAVLSRPFGRLDKPYRGIDILVEFSKPTRGKGVVTVIADGGYDVVADIDDLLLGSFDKSNLLLATLSLIEKDYYLEKDQCIRIMSPVKPGASMGTSAAVAVGLTKALTDSSLCPEQIAHLAWRAETEVMGGESGTQDQVSAAYPYYAKLIDIPCYPKTTCQPVLLSENIIRRMEEGLMTVFYGKHDSTEMHRKVIKELTANPDSPTLAELRELAKEALHYLVDHRGDLKGFGQVMQKNTVAQMGLYDGLVGQNAKRIIKLAKEHQAYGWKVNGAGGTGGSISLLFPHRSFATSFYGDCRDYFNDYIYYEHKLFR